MYTETERVTFVAVDESGQSVKIEAHRRVEYQLGSPPRKHTWDFCTIDHRQVEFVPAERCYVVHPEGNRLTSTDPNQPKECRPA